MSMLLRGFRFWLPAWLLVGAMNLAAQAAVTYVDARDGATANTTLAPSAGGGAWITNAGDTADGLWRLRPGFGLAASATSVPSAAFDASGGNVYESTGNVSPSDAVPRLVTTVAGLPANTYNVYAYWWADQNASPWRIRAGLIDDLVNPLPLYSGGAAPGGSPLPNDTGGRDGANRVLWRASLGQTTGTSISVYVDDAPAANGNERTWYDGIGYEAVPEPGTLVLVGLAIPALLLAARRRGKS